MISVIMPAHNEEERIAAAVESVFSQSFEAVELIVVDDASSDGTVDVLRRLQQSHPALTVVVQPDNQGPGPGASSSPSWTPTTRGTRSAWPPCTTPCAATRRPP